MFNRFENHTILFPIFCFCKIEQNLAIARYFYAVKFSFKAEVDGQLLTLTAERIYRSKQSERFKLSITGTDYILIVQPNRPFVEAKNNGKAAQWHIVEGIAQDKSKLEKVYQQLEKAIKNQPPSFQGTLNFINQF